MTLDNILSQVGIGGKQIERYSEYGAPADQHIFYTYEPSTHGHAPVTKSSYGGGLKSNASMSALTLLAFLFFLHILQQCIKEHMNDMNTPPVMIMSASRDSETKLNKDLTKIDKSGREEEIENETNTEINQKELNQIYEEINPYQIDDENRLMKINFAEYLPKHNKQKHNVYKSYANRSSIYAGFVTREDNL